MAVPTKRNKKEKVKGFDTKWFKLLEDIKPTDIPEGFKLSEDIYREQKISISFRAFRQKLDNLVDKGVVEKKLIFVKNKRRAYYRPV